MKKEPELKEDVMYVCFHKPSGIAGLLISLWTAGKYSHAEFIYNGKKYLSNPGGVRYEDYVHKRNHDIYELNSLIDPKKILE